MVKVRLFKILGILLLIIIAIPIFLVSWFFYQVRQEGKSGSPLVLDQVLIWEQPEWKNEKHTLARIVTGFQDKTEEVALFKGVPQYDKGGNPLYNNVVFRELIDQDGNTSHQYQPIKRTAIKGHLEVESNRIRVTFDNGEQQFFNLTE